MGKGKNDEEQVDFSQDMKSKVQPSQDNRDPMVKKLEKGDLLQVSSRREQVVQMPSICQEDGQGCKEEVEAHHQELPHLHQAQPQEQDQEQHLHHQEEG
jgi:hypothetical protein